MDILKVVDLCRNAALTVALVHANHFSLETQLDVFAGQGISKIQRKVQSASFRKRMLRQEINAILADIASHRLFIADVNRHLKMNTLCSPFFKMTHSLHLMALWLLAGLQLL